MHILHYNELQILNYRLRVYEYRMGTFNSMYMKSICYANIRRIQQRINSIHSIYT